MEKSIIIAGAGISGLSAGCYGQMNGYRTTIFEMHNIPGGLCTAWKRKGYTFDISMHMLTGSFAGPIKKMWQELGVIKNFKFHYHDHMSLVEGADKSLLYCSDRKKLETQMIALSPDDSKLIREFIRLIFGRDMMNAASLKPSEFSNIIDKLKTFLAVLPLIGTFTRYKKMTIQEFALQFKDPLLREAVRMFIDTPGWPMVDFPMVVLSGFMKSGVTEAGVPLGGSQQVADMIAGLYQELGGVIRYSSRVKEMIIENNRVTGIRLEDNTQHMADQVIWAGDGHYLLYDILGGKYLNDNLRKMYDSWIPVKPIVQVMMGVNRDLSDEPHRIIIKPDKPITIAGKEHRWICILHHCFDPSMAPAGKSVVEVWYDTEYNYWEELAHDRKRYKEEKQRIAEFTISELDRRWPGFASQVEVTDVPTPVTYTRYTGNWQGSPDGWYITPENMFGVEPLRSVPGLEGLYMVGQWTSPFTGTVGASLSGRQLIEHLCRKERRKFVVKPL